MIERAAEAALAATLNHVLARNAWARDALARHAGDTLELALAGLSPRLAVDEAGWMRGAEAAAPAPSDGTPSDPAGGHPREPTARVEIDPALLLALPLRGRDALRDARTSGDDAFLHTLFHLAGHLEWDVEADLARLFGDIAAARLTRDAARLRAWSTQAARGVERSLGEYLTQEIDALPARDDIETWLAGVDRLRDDCARLEARLALLERATLASSPRGEA